MSIDRNDVVMKVDEVGEVWMSLERNEVVAKVDEVDGEVWMSLARDDVVVVVGSGDECINSTSSSDAFDSHN